MDSRKPNTACNKTLRYETKKRTKLKNRTNKTKNPFDITNYKKQRNYIVQLQRKVKLGYFNNFDSNKGKPFWVKCKPYFSNKHSKANTDATSNEKCDILLY